MNKSRFADRLLRLDDWRVRQHFKRVERRLRARDVSHLSPELRQTRARNLDQLHAYAERGIFPRNHERPGYAPCFIDPDGRECAVAHLVMQSGHDDDAHQIAGVANYAFVPQMRFAELDAWAAESGFTKEELTRIQPAYSPCDPWRTWPELCAFVTYTGSLISLATTSGLLGILVAAINGIRIARRQTGMVAPVLGLAITLCLLFAGLALWQSVETARELLANPSVGFYGVHENTVSGFHQISLMSLGLALLSGSLGLYRLRISLIARRRACSQQPAQVVGTADNLERSGR